MAYDRAIIVSIDEPDSDSDASTRQLLSGAMYGVYSGDVGAFGRQALAYELPEAAPDYPAESDVRDGVEFDSGTSTGNLELPAEADVRDGVDYGANGAEFTGTLEPGGGAGGGNTCF